MRSTLLLLLFVFSGVLLLGDVRSGPFVVLTNFKDEAVEAVEEDEEDEEDEENVDDEEDVDVEEVEDVEDAGVFLGRDIFGPLLVTSATRASFT